MPPGIIPPGSPPGIPPGMGMPPNVVATLCSGIRSALRFSAVCSLTGTTACTSTALSG